MRWVYRVGVFGYHAAIRLAARWNSKARARQLGARQSLRQLSPTPPGQDCFWMHCASVGEFEQGRPVWDRIQREYPSARFVLSFYSPSGYEQFCRKANVGEVHYLPNDSAGNAQTWVDRLKPRLALLVKYEWWLGYHEALHVADVPTVLISAAFRQNQPFFRWYGDAWRTALRNLAVVFVQDNASRSLLAAVRTRDVQVVGDTRLDRTVAIRDAPFQHDALQNFCANRSYVLIAGSTWPADNLHLCKAISALKKSGQEVTLVVAPHEVGEASIEACEHAYAAFNPLRLSKIERQEQDPAILGSYVLIIDSIGLLSKLYRLGDAAYVGGGFGAGIHNTLEPTVYGLPIAVGPNHGKFVEVRELARLGIITLVNDASDIAGFLAEFADSTARKMVLAKADDYLQANVGATSRIWEVLRSRNLV